MVLFLPPTVGSLVRTTYTKASSSISEQMITFVVSSSKSQHDEAALESARLPSSPKRAWSVPPARGGPTLPSPRLPQPYSPRRPSPLGFNPPIASIEEYDETPAFPLTPDRLMQRTAIETATPDLPEARRPLAGWQRRRSQPPPPPLILQPNQSQHHQSSRHEAYGSSSHAQQPLAEQPTATAAMRPSPPSPTPSSASSVSLYSSDSVKKRMSMEIQQKGDHSADERPGFFSCFSFCCFIKPKRRNKALESRILGPTQAPSAPEDAPPVAPPQMRENRRRPPPLNM